MIAFSGLVNDEVRKKCREAGFAITIDSPLSVQKINELIFPMLENRRKNLGILLS
jgi:hypothetical protein